MINISLNAHGIAFCFAVGILHFSAINGNTENISNATKRQVDWFNAGVGTGSFDDSRGISFSYPYGKGLVSLRAIHNFSETKSTSRFGNSITETVWDFGAFYGMISKAPYGLASVSGGIGIVSGLLGKRDGRSGYDYFIKPFSGDDTERFLTLGIPFEGQLFWTPTQVIGIGIYGFANLNREKPFAGVLLGIQMGSLK